APVLEGEVGRHAAGADVRAANSQLAKLVVERSRQPDLPELRRAVDGLVWQPSPSGLRGKGDHVALASEHVGQRAANRVDGAFEIDVEHFVEVLAGEIEERTVGADARVRHDDVDAAEPFGGGLAEFGERVEVADVAGARGDALEPEVAAAARREAEVAATVMEHSRYCGA